MMSDYDGFERPYPTWFPYFCAALLLLGVAVYWIVGDRLASPSRQTQDELSIARNKAPVATKRRA
jgi:hypothetical protein